MRKKIVFQSDFSLAKTGFGRNSKAILKYLYDTGKYDIVNYCCGMQKGNAQLERTPWKSCGSLPNTQQEVDKLNKDPHLARLASYGAHLLDEIIKEEKPDVYIAVQDIWGVDFAIDKPWFNKINSVIWTTLDSLPILESAVKCAPKVKNYWIWSDFATKALHNLGHKHVKTVHGALDTNNFRRLPDQDRKLLRAKFNIDENKFMVGFVFRNQLRKSVPNLLEGYAIWKKENNIKNSGLLLHTHFGEGWNIMKLASEYGIDPKEIYTTYICKVCGSYEVKNFTGQDLDCKFCGNQKSQTTTNVGIGVSEEELNEVYNLMDVYCHPFTSGGQEIPIQEAKLTELITLVTNYSCGEEMCQKEAFSFPLEWNEYREHGTEFIKASTCPKSIAKNLQKVYSMPKEERLEYGKNARQWTIDNYSVETIGKFIEEFIDSCPTADKDFSFKIEEKDPYHVVPEIKDDGEWVKYLYEHILKAKNMPDTDDGYKYWMEEIKKGTKRIDIENYFRQVALQDNNKNKQISFEDLLDKEDVSKRLLYVMPESIGDVYLSTSLFKSIKEQYPDYNLYVATKPEYFEVLEGNPFVHKVIQYMSQMDSLPWLEGIGSHKGYFEIAFLPYSQTQRFLTYLHNGKTNIAYKDYKYAHN
jgi:glycosyltransferase involved in cell wall biosynthesis